MLSSITKNHTDFLLLQFEHDLKSSTLKKKKKNQETLLKAKDCPKVNFPLEHINIWQTILNWKNLIYKHNAVVFKNISHVVFLLIK